MDKDLIDELREHNKDLRENAKSKDVAIDAKNVIIQMKDAQLYASQILEKELRERLALSDKRNEDLGDEMDQREEELLTQIDQRDEKLLATDEKLLATDEKLLATDEKLAATKEKLDRALEDKDILLAQNASLKDASIVQLETLAELYKKMNLPTVSRTLTLKKLVNDWSTGIFELENSDGQKSKWELQMLKSNGWLALYNRSDTKFSVSAKLELKPFAKSYTMDFGCVEPQMGVDMATIPLFEFNEKTKILQSVEMRAEFSVHDVA